jgi:predicted Fe-S protein YdhL (DUF1289 family)
MTTKLTTEQLVLQGRARSASPCVGVCAPAEGSEGGFCRGCYRNYEEIANWSEYSTETRLEVLYKVHFRRRVG